MTPIPASRVQAMASIFHPFVSLCFHCIIYDVTSWLLLGPKLAFTVNRHQCYFELYQEYYTAEATDSSSDITFSFGQLQNSLACTRLVHYRT